MSWISPNLWNDSLRPKKGPAQPANLLGTPALSRSIQIPRVISLTFSTRDGLPRFQYINPSPSLGPFSFAFLLPCFDRSLSTKRSSLHSRSQNLGSSRAHGLCSPKSDADLRSESAVCRPESPASPPSAAAAGGGGWIRHGETWTWVSESLSFSDRIALWSGRLVPAWQAEVADVGSGDWSDLLNEFCFFSFDFSEWSLDSCCFCFSLCWKRGWNRRQKRRWSGEMWLNSLNRSLAVNFMLFLFPFMLFLDKVHSFCGDSRNI